MRISLEENEGEARSLGAVLKNKRKSKGLSIKKVAQELRIKENYVKAIENDQLDQLPTQAHQKIMVKTYSDFLGIDFKELKKDFELDQKATKTPREKTEQNSTFFPVLAGILVGTACILAFLTHMPEEETNYPESESVHQGVLAETSSVFSPVESTLVERMTLRLEGKEDSWVQVMADNDTLFDGILRQGTAWECKAENQFTVNVARSWAVVGYVDSQLLLPFGSHGEFAKKRILTKENFPAFLDSSKIKKDLHSKGP